MFVYRMITAAITLTTPVLELLDKLNIPNSYINENKFFVGHGADLAPGPQISDASS